MKESIKEDVLLDLESSLESFFLELKKLERISECDQVMWQQLDEFQYEQVDNIFCWIERIQRTRLYKSI